MIALPQFINSIPLASLAALLVYTGYRLASPDTFAKTLDVGREQLALFVTTVLGVLAFNLLAGVAIGIVAKLILHTGRGVSLKNLLRISYQIEHQTEPFCHIRIQGAAIFSNFLALKSELGNLPPGKRLCRRF